MGHVLLISDNEVINNVYAINLKAYVAANVTIKSSIEDAIKLLEVGTDLDVIISFKKIKGTTAALDIHKYLKENKINTPLVVIGSDTDLPPGVQVVSSQFNIKALLRTVAKILEITAKDMVDISVPEFFPLPVKLFANLEKVECDVYYKKSAPDQGGEGSSDVAYLKIWEKNSKIKGSVEKLLKEGVINLFIPSSERLRFINLASDIVIAQLERPDLTMEERVEAVEQGIELVANKLFDNNEMVKEEVMRVSTACVRAVKNIIEETPKLEKLLNQLLANKTKYIYLHSVLAAYIASGIIENVSWGGEGHSEKISFVLFFHDIFLIPIFDKYSDLMSEDELLFGDKLNENEKELVLNHSRLAGEMVSTFKQIPIGADTIIKQHHGTTSGIGFAVNFKDDISPLAKVVIIAEDFVQDLLKHKSSKGKIVFDRKKTFERLYKKYNKQTYRRIIEALEKVKM